MDFFNIGTGELIFLILLAILVVGPKRSVELAQQAGRFVRRLQQEWQAVRRDLLQEVHTLRQEVSPFLDERVPAPPAIEPPSVPPTAGEDKAG